MEPGHQAWKCGSLEPWRVRVAQERSWLRESWIGAVEERRNVDKLGLLVQLKRLEELEEWMMFIHWIPLEQD